MSDLIRETPQPQQNHQTNPDKNVGAANETNENRTNPFRNWLEEKGTDLAEIAMERYGGFGFMENAVLILNILSEKMRIDIKRADADLDVNERKKMVGALEIIETIRTSLIKRAERFARAYSKDE